MRKCPSIWRRQSPHTVMVSVRPAGLCATDRGKAHHTALRALFGNMIAVAFIGNATGRPWPAVLPDGFFIHKPQPSSQTLFHNTKGHFTAPAWRSPHDAAGVISSCSANWRTITLYCRTRTNKAAEAPRCMGSRRLICRPRSGALTTPRALRPARSAGNLLK